MHFLLHIFYFYTLNKQPSDSEPCSGDAENWRDYYTICTEECEAVSTLTVLLV